MSKRQSKAKNKKEIETAILTNDLKTETSARSILNTQQQSMSDVKRANPDCLPYDWAALNSGKEVELYVWEYDDTRDRIMTDKWTTGVVVSRNGDRVKIKIGKVTRTYQKNIPCMSKGVPFACVPVRSSPAPFIFRAVH